VTVAAVVLAASPESALADADGLARVRRIADAAWAGGAIPIVVVSFDPGGAVAAALAGAPVTLVEPAPVEGGPVAQIARGIAVATQLVEGTDASLVWPARMAWAGPETATSLIEAHGTRPDALIRPSYGGEPGWPALLPLAAASSLASIGPDRMPDQIVADLVAAGTPTQVLDLGDPGTSMDAGVPRADLPPYDGPPEPASGHVHEWGDDIEALPELPSSPPVVRRPAD
jgi:CTP:molybdopterin cytidylyltransferase MocA